jgi:hypothetical protein
VLTIAAEILFCHWLGGEKDWSEKRGAPNLLGEKHPKKNKIYA